MVPLITNKFEMTFMISPIICEQAFTISPIIYEMMYMVSLIICEMTLRYHQ